MGQGSPLRLRQRSPQCCSLQAAGTPGPKGAWLLGPRGTWDSDQHHRRAVRADLGTQRVASPAGDSTNSLASQLPWVPQQEPASISTSLTPPSQVGKQLGGGPAPSRIPLPT